MSDMVITIEVHTPANGHGGGDTLLIKNFADILRGKTKESVAPLSDGIESALICLKAKESAETCNEYRRKNNKISGSKKSTPYEVVFVALCKLFKMIYYNCDLETT